MTQDQIMLFALFGLVFAGLLWGRWRYDIVAFAALVVALLLGLVPLEHAFDGFGHEATIIVALVLIVSRGLTNAGAVDLITRLFTDGARSVGAHIALFGAVGGVLSAFMNNVAALALLMPVDVQAASKAGRPPGQTLMPLSFATILGGMATLIGTPPNIIIASYRGEALGDPFGMFDFAPVGLATAAAGIAFIALGGWRLIPVPPAPTTGKESLEGFVADLVVPEDSKIVGMKMPELDEAAESSDCEVLGLIRRGKRLPGRARREVIKAGDHLVVEATSDNIDSLAGTLGLSLKGPLEADAALGEDLVLAEAVVPHDSRFVGRSAADLRLSGRYRTSLLGLSRQGKTIREKIRNTELQTGDVLLLVGRPEAVDDTIARTGVLPLKSSGRTVTRHARAGMAIGIFAAALALAALGFVALPVALAAVALIYTLTDIVPAREIYQAVEWPVVVLLASFIPLGAALESSGGTQLIADGLAQLSASFPAWVALTLLMILTMTMSDLLNNTATAIVAAPVGIGMAQNLGVNPDPFLMAVAVAASCAFLTPIGHKNNLLILGPGGYRFSDYWRLGLPLEVLVVAVSVPAILLVWPL